MKSLCVPLYALLLAVAVPSAHAGDETKVTAQVHGFYQWYFHLVNTSPGESEIEQHRKGFSRYISAHLIKKIAHLTEGEGQEGDPFFKQPDWDPGWAKNIAVSHVKIGAKGHATAEVLLSGKEMEPKRLKITLVTEDGTYKIDAVDEIVDSERQVARQLRSFYQWYVHSLGGGGETPASNPNVELYVTEARFKKLAEAGTGAGQEGDYFLKSQDWDPEWEKNVEVKHVVLDKDNLHATLEVLLTGKKIPRAHLKVLLLFENGNYKIDGVEKIKD